MASGFGTFDSSTHYNVGSSGYGWLLNRTVVSQLITGRVVKVTIVSYLAYYRNSGGTWTGAISHNHSTGNYIKVSIQGESDTSSGTELGLSSATVTPGNFYYTGAGNISAYNVAEWSKVVEYNLGDSGAAVTRTWATSIKYGSTIMNCGGTFTTDSLTPVVSCHLYGPVNGRAREIGKLYGSVNGVAKKITKLYAGDENGIARLIYKG